MTFSGPSDTDINQYTHFLSENILSIREKLGFHRNSAFCQLTANNSVTEKHRTSIKVPATDTAFLPFHFWLTDIEQTRHLVILALMKLVKNFKKIDFVHKMFRLKI